MDDLKQKCMIPEKNRACEEGYDTIASKLSLCRNIVNISMEQYYSGCQNCGFNSDVYNERRKIPLTEKGGLLCKVIPKSNLG